MSYHLNLQIKVWMEYKRRFGIDMYDIFFSSIIKYFGSQNDFIKII